MADRVLTWYVSKPVEDSTVDVGPAYVADQDYVPGDCQLTAASAPKGGDLKVDIRADGVSIFTSQYAALNKGGTQEDHAEDYAGEPPQIAAGAVVKLYIIETNGASGISCHLELDTLYEE